MNLKYIISILLGILIVNYAFNSCNDFHIIQT